MGVRISAGIPTAVLSSFAENTTGASLVKRLEASSTTIGDNTRMVLIKGSDVFAIDDENYKKIADVLRRDGLIAFPLPNGRNTARIEPPSPSSRSRAPGTAFAPSYSAEVQPVPLP